jgi:hypothetical protein
MASEAAQLATEALAIDAAEIAALKVRYAGSSAVVNSTHWHESGHIVAMVALGCPPDSGTIVPAGDFLGKVTRDQLAKLTAGEMGAICMAGMVAQREYLKRANLPCDEETLAAGGSKDLADVEKMLLANALDCRLDMFLSIATAQAVKLLEANWLAVTRIAAELFERKTLNREEIEAAYAPR